MQELPSREKSPEKEIVTNPFADAFEAGAEDKEKKSDLAEDVQIPGYPDKTTEFRDPSSESYKKALPLLRDKMKKMYNRPPRNRDVAGVEIENFAYYLLIDDKSAPKERVFKCNEEVPKPGEYGVTATEIPEDRIQRIVESYERKYEDYSEARNVQSDIVSRAVRQFREQTGREMNTEESSVAYDNADFEYIVICDKAKKDNQYRVFKSKRPVPPKEEE